MRHHDAVQQSPQDKDMATNANPRLSYKSNLSTTEWTDSNESGTAARSLEDGNVSQQAKAPKVTARRAGKTKKRTAIIIFSMRSGRIKARRAIPRRSAMVSITSRWPPPATETVNEKEGEEARDEEEEGEDEEQSEEM
ncbi:hypothetical protein MMYC01_208125 [Madurella mycetomatis]|uniref:Uncharacterized protein n=1 Tax=Madurella mycetomatis TaxID=100816 RepID=A0A175VVT5_9PEZI|nr:hypothetical protein MMYC01_208125 [Madurella mycetomatis]